ncbi:MAG: hypothetical protein WBA12_14860 [Catalinimonas sp.]
MTVRCLLLLGLCALLLQGCFDVRTPEPPAPAAGGWTPPTDPEILLDNFRRATADLNLVNYERCFDAATFRFTPDPDVLGNNLGLFQEWSLIDELEYLKNIQEASASTEQNRLELRRIAPDTYLTPDSLVYVADYTLTVTHQNEEELPFTFEGNINLTLRFRDNEWAISQWQDNQTGTEPCWTELKQYFIVD